MKIQSSVWLPPARKTLPRSVSEEAARSCYLGKIYTYLESRTAYHGRDSYTAGRYCLSLEPLKWHLESLRKQGSTFSIYEIPVVVLQGLEHAVLLIERTSRLNPNYSSSRDRLVGVNLGSICRAIGEENDIALKPVPVGAMAPAGFPFKVFRHKFWDPADAFLWTDTGMRAEVDSALSLCHETASYLNRGGGN